MTETTVPILPCRSMDDLLDFYEVLGFEVTYRQKRPNTYVAVRRGGIELQFFVLKGLDPANSYSTCYVRASDVDALYQDFTAGLRAAFGRVPSRGVPRVNPLKNMSYGVRQFVVVDPGGNYLRIGQPIPVDEGPRSRLSKAIGTAVALGDSKDDSPAAARVLDLALAAHDPVTAAERFRALVLRADLALRLDDGELARRLLSDAEQMALDDTDRAGLTDDLRRARELQEALAVER